MPRVRNRVTGLVHDVPAGHPALTDDRHDVLPEPEPVELVESEVEETQPEPRPRRRRSK